MKDSFGGTFIISIFIIFLGIYIFFIALTLRYAQGFKAKNAIISFIEQYDGVKDSIGLTPPTSEVENRIKEYLAYYKISPDKLFYERIDILEDVSYEKKCYYKVYYQIDWKWPFFNIDGTWEIKGESKNVKNCGSIDKVNIEP